MYTLHTDTLSFFFSLFSFLLDFLLRIQVMGSASFIGAMQLHDFVSDLVEAAL